MVFTLENISNYPTGNAPDDHCSFDLYYFGEFRAQIEEDQNYFNKLNQKLSGQILIDLGAGIDTSSYELFQKMNLKGYVAVEPFNMDLISWRFDYLKQEENTHLPYKLWETDILQALENIPDNSVSILTSGLSNGLIEDEHYCNEAKKLITQKLHPEGVYISWAAWNFIPSDLQQNREIRLWSRSKAGIYTKK